jgi:hypothetical protein
MLYEILLYPVFVLCVISVLRRAKDELAVLPRIVHRGVLIPYLGFLGP